MEGPNVDGKTLVRRRSRRDLVFSMVALLLLTGGGVLIADITHRVIASDPDGFAILSIALQIATVAIASSAFTKRSHPIHCSRLCSRPCRKNISNT